MSTPVDNDQPSWRPLGRVHLLLSALGMLVIAAITAVVTLHAAVTSSELDRAVTPIQTHVQRVDDLVRNYGHDLGKLEGELHAISQNTYAVGRQVGAPVLPPPTHADAGVAP